MAKYASERRLDVPRSIAVIDALGGTVKVAKAFGISHPSVTAWRKRGIPENRLRVIQLLHGKVPAVRATNDFQPWASRA